MRLAVVLAVAGAFTRPAPAQVPTVDAAVPVYRREAPVSGTLNSVGSDTMNNLMTLWGEEFRKVHPTVRIQVEGKGSSTAPPALIAGTAQLGPMSRAMKASELEAIESKYGYQPIEIVAALDVLAVYVHKDNPIASLALPEIDAMFSKGRKGGFPTDIRTWGQLGVKGALADKPVSLYGRNSASGTYGYFKDHALFKGDFKDTVKEQPGSASVVQGITEDPAGIGYSGIGYRTSGVRVLPVAASVGGPAFGADYEHALDGSYPLSRNLFVYVVRDPRAPMDPLVREFLRFVLSRAGQQVVIKDGFLPLPAAVVEAQLAKLD